METVSPFLEDTLALHPFPYVVSTGATLRSLLAGRQPVAT